MHIMSVLEANNFCCKKDRLLYSFMKNLHKTERNYVGKIQQAGDEGRLESRE